MTTGPRLCDDFLDLLDAFLERGVEFLIVGAHALAAHGIVRATADIDIWVRPTDDNAVRVYAALGDFGAPLTAHGVAPDDFCSAGVVYQIGLPPFRIDVMTAVSGVAFDDAWCDRLEVVVDERRLPVLGRASLIHNKRASGRPKDLVDLDLLGKLD